MKYILFDFNGTILDDTDMCIEIENQCIRHFLPNRPLLTKDEYLHLFCFPVKKYYERVGFTWEQVSYEEVGDYWYDLYKKNKHKYKLHEGVKEILEATHQKGLKNILLSVSSLSEMQLQLKELGIEDYFDEVLGINNIYAHSKIEIGKNWIKDKDPKECFMIGDTLHDLETAQAMNIDCVLVANGHQAKDVLLKQTNKVVDHISEVQI